MKSLVMAISAKTVVNSFLSTLHMQVLLSVNDIFIENHPDGV